MVVVIVVSHEKRWGVWLSLWQFMNSSKDKCSISWAITSGEEVKKPKLEFKKENKTLAIMQGWET